MNDRVRCPWPGGAVHVNAAWFQTLFFLVFGLWLASKSLILTIVVIAAIVVFLATIGYSSMRNAATARSEILQVY